MRILEAQLQGQVLAIAKFQHFPGVTMGQLALSQFFLYGKRHFTSSGWEMHKANYAQPDRAVVPQWYENF